jgi:asparagine synthase (glutamine-hydrolysing)
MAAGDPYVALLDGAAPAVRRLSFMARVSYAEARTYMHDVLLRDTDQMSMRHALEIRVPLLDHALVEYVMGLPDETRRGHGGPKALLAERLAGVVPADLIRQPKRGFVLPFAAWMRSALRPYCDERLLGGALTRRAGMDGATIDALWAGFLAGRRDVTWSRLWTLVALSAWLDANGIAA